MVKDKALEEVLSGKEEDKETILYPYLGIILEELPTAVQRTSPGNWGRTLDTLVNLRRQDSLRLSSKRFAQRLMQVSREIDQEALDYCLDEVSTINEKVKKSVKRSNYDLELTILESVKDNLPKFGKKNLSALHDLFLRMYSHGETSYLDSSNNFKEILGLLEEFSENEVAAIVDKALKLFKCDFAKRTLLYDWGTLKEMNGLVVGFCKASARNLRILGNNFSDWYKTALSEYPEISELAMFFEDNRGYFRERAVKSTEGLHVSKIKERLGTYVQALTGKRANIEAEGSDLSCSFREDSFIFPEVVNIDNTDEGNFQAYKAMASYQAGALLFGTYELEEDFFDSFENPEAAKRILEILERGRIGRALQERYPGLVSSLDLFRENYLAAISSRSKNELDAIYLEIEKGSYGEGEGELEKIVAEKVKLSRTRGDTINETCAAVKEIYEFLKTRVDLSQKPNTPPLLTLDIEEGKKLKSPGYLQKEPEDKIDSENALRYDEWDNRLGEYKPRFVQVIPIAADHIENSYVADALAKNIERINRLKQHFENMKPEEFEVLRNQVSGEVDYNAAVRAAAEMKAGITPSEKLYTRRFKNNRSVASIVLSENSGSLRRFLDIDHPDMRIIDVIKHSKIFISEALEALGDRYALASFSGETERAVEFSLIKDFDKPYDQSVRNSIGSMKPMKQNRDGAGIRHATHLLAQQPEKTLLLFYLMEGLPNDFGYKDEYAIEDTKRAIIEAKSKKCLPIVLAYGPKINEAIRSIGEHAIYREVKDPKDLPEMLPALYGRLTF